MRLWVQPAVLTDVTIWRGQGNYTWYVEEAAEKPHKAGSEVLVEKQEQEGVHNGVHEWDM